MAKTKKTAATMVVDVKAVEPRPRRQPAKHSTKVSKKQGKPTRQLTAKAKKNDDSKALVAIIEPGALTSSNDPLVTYLNEIRRYPLLTPEEEHELAIRYREKGDKIAAEKLVTSNLRFVVKVAAEYSKFGAKMIDLVQEGNVGLMHAVREFNPYKGVRLITYAVWWIKGYIREYLMRQHSLVRVGTTQNQKKLFYNLAREQKEIESMGETAAIGLLSERLGVPEKDVKDMQQRLQGRDVSLDAPLDAEGDTNLMSFQKDETAESPEAALIQHEQTALLREKIDVILPKLNEKEKYILEARLLADEPITLQEVGDRYGITRERARQLESRVMEKLKGAFNDASTTKK